MNLSTEILKRLTPECQTILKRIEKGEVSASMSGIEYYMDEIREAQKWHAENVTPK